MALLLLVLALGAAALPLAARASNGLNLIGFGAESVAMGGADTAVARDTTALNSNPAGLGQLGRPAFDAYLTAAFSLDVGHADGLGNDSRVDNKIIPVGGFGASRPLLDGRFVAAVGFFAQGGSGAVYKSLRTPFGGSDELSALVGFARFTPGRAWRVNQTLTVGAALPLNLMLARQRVFPATSVAGPADPARSFFGLKLDRARGARFGLRLGVMARPADDWTLGATFAPRTPLDATGGEAELNLTAIGRGIVSYRDARIEGFALAREFALGAAWQATPRTLVLIKLAHLDWSAALRGVSVTLEDPADPAAPQVVSQTQRVTWRDQTVAAVGVAHRIGDAGTLYGGFNHGRLPVRRDTLTPQLAAVADRHWTGGFAWRRADGWSASGAVEYQPLRRVAYFNPAFPLGDRSEERSRYVALSLMLGRRW